METSFVPPRPIATRVHTEMPAELRRPGVTERSRANKRGLPVDCFLEGPCFDREGNLHVTDIPHGRVFRISPERRWTPLAEYDGEPNGLRCTRTARACTSPTTGRASCRSTSRRGGWSRCSRGGTASASRARTTWSSPAAATSTSPTRGRPDGLALSPDEEVLFVAMPRDNAVWRLPLLPDGSTAKVGRFASFHGTSGPDGLAMDAAGNLLVAHASLGSVFVLSPQGEPIARMRSCRGATTTNLTFGGPEGWTVFVTESETGAVLAAEWAQEEQEPHAA